MILIFGGIIVGTLVGLMSSTLGLGGGLVIVPALSLYLGFTQHEAVATSLFTIFFVTLLNVWRFQKQKLIDWQVVLLIAVFAAGSSFVAGRASAYLSQIFLIILFLLFLVYLIFQTFAEQKARQPQYGKKSKIIQASKVGFLSGIISGLTGVGGGSITTPLLMASGQIEPQKVVPISNSVMLFTSLFASISYMTIAHPEPRTWQVGYIHIDLGLILFISAIPGACVGTRWQHRLPQTRRKILLGLFLIIILIRMTWRLWELV